MRLIYSITSSLCWGLGIRPPGDLLQSIRWIAQCMAFGICLSRGATGRKGAVGWDLFLRFGSFTNTTLFSKCVNWRLWWVFAFLLSVYGCGKLIANVYVKWDQSPVIVSFAEKSTPVWEIPFPAVTICPETKTNTSMLNFTEIYHELINSQPPYSNLSSEE